MITDKRLLSKAMVCMCLLFGALCVWAQECSEYNRQLDSLSSNKKSMLGRYQVVQERGGLLISPKMIGDCRLSIGVARFIWDGVVANTTDGDNEFAVHHRPLINSAVRKIWPLIADSSAIPSDGNLYSEKWNLLRNKLVDDATVTALVSRNITHKGLWGDASYLLIERPLPQLTLQVQSIFKSKSSTTVERLYAVAVLSRIAHLAPLRLLEKTASEVRLTDVEQRTVTKLKARFAVGQPAEWGDIEDLLVEEI